MKSTPAPVGRPRGFDADEALDRAVELFWRQGYEGTSLSDLTAAMGINRPSLYAAFGNKEALFRKALDRYAEARLAFTREALAQPTARAVVEGLLLGSVDAQTPPRGPRGCLAVQGALACGPEAAAIQRELAARRAAGEAALRDRLERAQREGDLPADADPADLARFATTVMQGTAVQAAAGASRTQLRRVVLQALRAWPR